jgi:hypothetical protein
VDIAELARLMKMKEMKLNYTIALNDYYERLFGIPEKLKRYAKAERNGKLRERLEKVHGRFLMQENQMRGILLPLQQSSCMVCSVLFRWWESPIRIA